MKSKGAAAPVAKEDPEAKARREVDEARAEADKTAALQNILDRRSRKIMRIFGKPAASAADSAGSGASGVPGAPSGAGFFSGDTAGSGRFVPPNLARFESQDGFYGPGIYY